MPTKSILSVNPLKIVKKQTLYFLLSLVFFTLSTFRSAAQIANKHIIDSLRAILKNTTPATDTNRIETLCAFGYAYFTINHDEALDSCKKALLLSQQTGWKKGKGLALNAAGKCYWAKSDYLTSLKYYQNALQIFTELGDNYNTAIVLKNIGGVNYAETHYDKALDYFNEALLTASRERNSQMYKLKYGEFGIESAISSTYASKGDFLKAIEHDSIAIKANERTGNEAETGRFIADVASFRCLLGDYAGGRKEIARALAICSKYNDLHGRGKCYEVAGWIEASSNNFLKGIQYFREALNCYKQIDDKGHVIRNYASIGNAYLGMVAANDKLHEKTLFTGNFTRADALRYAAGSMEKAITMGLNFTSSVDLQYYERDLAAIYELQGNYAKAIGALKQYDIFKDSVAGTQIQKKYTQQLLQFEYDKQRDSLNYLNKLQETKLAHLEEQKQLNELKERQLIWYSITAITVLGLLTSVFIFRNRLQRVNLKNELAKEKSDKLLKEAEFKSRMNDITISALRSQMNPHFIFNCLNSIKLYTEQNNAEAASEYLSKFSRLIRRILDSAQSPLISLADEIELQSLYLDMECMRFKEKLAYSLTVDEEIDTNFIQIPPLLIQPYIENAIWHGLMHKAGGGHISVKMILYKNQTLIFTVEDNGIGRVKSAELKSKQEKNHNSLGTRLTAERIALINEKYMTNAVVAIDDLYDETLTPLGTRVTIQLTIK